MLGRVRAWLAGLEEAATGTHLTEGGPSATRLAELAMSHGDLAKLLGAACKAQHPGPDVYCWVRDVYDDAVVYELSNRDDVTKLYRRTYSVDDAGTVTLGEPEAVVATTQYVAADEAAGDGLAERQFTQGERDSMAKSGQAMPDGGFPIATKGDLRNAIQAYGRAANKAAAKRHIVKRAKALGATDLLPEDWQESAGNGTLAGLDDLTGDLVPLVEKAVAKDGAVKLKLIQAGQGSSGYYPAEVLKRDGPKVFTAGLHMHLDHPSVSEEADRPERSVTTLAGTLTSDARWQAEGAAGPGLYAEAKVRSDLAPLIEELAPHIGVSIRALGKAGTREIGGKRVRTIEAIEQAKSVDFVTVPGAGGKVLDLVESARARRAGGTFVPDAEVDEVDKEALEEANRKIAELQGRIDAQEAREREAAVLREAHGIVVAELAKIDLPAPTRERLATRLAANPPVADGAVDRDALTAAVKEAATAELAYLRSVTGGNPVKGMGGGAPQDPETPKLEESAKRIEAALAEL